MGHNEEINLQVTDAINRKIKDILCFIESSTAIPSNNEKIRQLNYVEEIIRSFRTNWKAKKLNPAYAPLLIDNFENILKANIDNQNMAPFIREVPYEVGLVTSEIFATNSGYEDSKKILYLIPAYFVFAILQIHELNCRLMVVFYFSRA